MKGIRGALACVALSVLVAFGTAAAAEAHIAYVADRDDDAVIPFDTATGEVGEPIAVGDEPVGIAITPDGTRAYVANFNSGTVSVIDTSANAVVATITVGMSPLYIAIAPDGQTAYVTHADSDFVSVIDTQSNTVTEEFSFGFPPAGVAVSPDGRYLYVASSTISEVAVYDLDPDGGIIIRMINLLGAFGIAFAPDGSSVYITAQNGNYVAAVRTQDWFTSPISVATVPVAVAVTPDGETAYVANFAADSVSVIDTDSKSVVKTITVPDVPVSVAITPDGKTAYVYSAGEGTLTPIDTETNEASEPIEVAGPGIGFVAGMAITPNQPPTAEFTADRHEAYPGEPVTFDVAPPTDDIGVESARLSFGDGSFVTPEDGGTYKHAYSDPGTYEATLTVDDGEGCEPLAEFFPPLASPFTGQTAYCNGPSEVSSSVQIEVREPAGLRLKVGVKRPQHSLRQVRLRASCERIECRVRAQGNLGLRWPGAGLRTFPLAPATKKLGADRSTTLRLEIPSEARRAARKALRRGGRVWARVRVVASAPGDQRRVRVKRVRIVPR
jgi:YVTN family beta-propeller protein